MNCKLFVVAKFICFAFVVLSLLGCGSRLNKFYDYEMSSSEVDGFGLIVSLVGTYVVDGNVTSKTAPYEMMVKVDTEDFRYSEFVVDDFDICDLNGVVIVGCNDMRSSVFLVMADGKMVARIFYQGLDLEYEEYQIKISFRALGESSSYSGEAAIFLNRKYHERKTFDLIEKIMSV